MKSLRAPRSRGRDTSGVCCGDPDVPTTMLALCSGPVWQSSPCVLGGALFARGRLRADHRAELDFFALCLFRCLGTTETTGTRPPSSTTSPPAAGRRSLTSGTAKMRTKAHCWAMTGTVWLFSSDPPGFEDDHIAISYAGTRIPRPRKPKQPRRGQLKRS